MSKTCCRRVDYRLCGMQLVNEPLINLFGQFLLIFAKLAQSSLEQCTGSVARAKSGQQNDLQP